jgi:DNA polymerase-4
MPSVRARRLCPHAVFIGGSYDRYTEASGHLHEILGEITPLVEGISIDEAFLDVTGAERLFGTGEEIARELRRRVGRDLQLSCSVGVATVKMIAKLASEAAKPRAELVRGRPVVTPGTGVFVVRPGEELDFLWPKPIRALWGVGPATGKKLAGLGVATVGDLARMPLELLVDRLGAASGRHLHDLSWGRDERAVEPSRGVKSVGHEQTYADDIVDPQRLGTEVVRLSDAVSARLAEGGLAGRTVTLKVRFADFRTITRSITTPRPVSAGASIARSAKGLLDDVDPGAGIRLLGVSLSNLEETSQLSFEDESKDSGVSPAIDEVRRRFGNSAIGPAALVRDGRVGTLRRGQQAWGPGAEGPPEKSDGKVEAVEDPITEPGV